MNSGPPLAPVLRLSEETQRERQALNSVVTFKLQRDPSKGVSLLGHVYPKLKHAMAPNPTGLALNNAYRELRSWIHREVREVVERTRVRLGMTKLYLIMRGEQIPNPQSRVLLSTERDALGVPRANLDWQLSPADKKTGLGNSHDQVGRYFMEHPVGRIARVDVAEPFEMWAATIRCGGFELPGTRL
jgi:hypothetical protein